jgi:hypothetical protein
MLYSSGINVNQTDFGDKTQCSDISKKKSVIPRHPFSLTIYIYIYMCVYITSYTTEELLGRNSSDSGLEIREYGRRDSSR